MAAELQVQPPEAPIPAGPISATTTTITPTTTAPLSSDNPGPTLAPKRQRRPSVRLGEIGDHQTTTVSYDSHVRRSKHHSWRLPNPNPNPSPNHHNNLNHHHHPSSKSVKARSLTNLVNGNGNENLHEIQDPEERNHNGDGNLEFANRKKAKRVTTTTTKRVRSNWATKIDDGAEGNSREDGNEGFRDFDPDSDSPIKEQSPVHSVDDMELDFWQRRQGRARVSESRENDAVELDNFPESDSRGMGFGSSEGVRSWLIELGLSRYAPVFEIHEVDDDVLPMLTLEDLKDMGINAVGSRRKMYTAIQKLRKGFS